MAKGALLNLLRGMLASMRDNLAVHPSRSFCPFFPPSFC